MLALYCVRVQAHGFTGWPAFLQNQRRTGMFTSMSVRSRCCFLLACRWHWQPAGQAVMTLHQGSMGIWHWHGHGGGEKAFPSMVWPYLYLYLCHAGAWRAGARRRRAPVELPARAWHPLRSAGRAVHDRLLHDHGGWQGAARCGEVSALITCRTHACMHVHFDSCARGGHATACSLPCTCALPSTPQAAGDAVSARSMMHDHMHACMLLLYSQTCPKGHFLCFLITCWSAAVVVAAGALGVRVKLPPHDARRARGGLGVHHVQRALHTQRP